MFDVLALQIKQTSSQLEYEITAEDGRELGRATQVAGPRPRRGLLAMFGSGVGDSRVVLEVRDAHGTPLCFVDRQGSSPVAIINPDGTPIGRLAEDVLATTQQLAAVGVAGLRRGEAVTTCQALLDAADQRLCQLNWKRRNTRREHASYAPPQRVLGCDYIDVNGVAVAELAAHWAFRKREYRLRLARPLPEPLRTLVIAAPFAFDLTRR